jgi:phosphohistidine phosphatase SixA
MSAMITHMEALLTSAQAKNKALSFVVVVPHWPAVKAWQALQSSSFKQANGFNIEATEHGFVDG